MVNTKEITILSITLGILVVCIIMFIGGFASHYGVENSSMISEQMNWEGIEERLNTTQQDAKDIENIVSSGSVFTTIVGLAFVGIWKIIKIVFNSILAMFEIIVISARDILHIPSIVTGGIMAIIIITLAFLAYKTLKTGE